MVAVVKVNIKKQQKYKIEIAQYVVVETEFFFFTGAAR